MGVGLGLGPAVREPTCDCALVLPIKRVQNFALEKERGNILSLRKITVGNFVWIFNYRGPAHCVGACIVFLYGCAHKMVEA
jgi:hypothetical protein